MSYGLLALLDDIAALAKMSASSLDDIAAQSLRTSTKSIGIVVDDAAVTPQFVSGVSPARELPAIWKITKWSLFNKLVIITPLALLLSAFLPGAITPLLMLGGLYLAFEGAEKVAEWTGLHAHHEEAVDPENPPSPEEVEKTTVNGAVRTDFILSTEIMVLSLSEVAAEPLITRIGVMVAIGIVFTIGVYGVVALIVRADDFGLRLAESDPDGRRGRIGRAIVQGVAPFLKFLGVVGTLAMLWVGGHLLVAGLAEYGFAGPEHLIHGASHAFEGIGGFVGAALAWLVEAALSGVMALAVGAAVVAGMQAVKGKTAH